MLSYIKVSGNPCIKLPSTGVELNMLLYKYMGIGVFRIEINRDLNNPLLRFEKKFVVVFREV